MLDRDVGRRAAFTPGRSEARRLRRNFRRLASASDRHHRFGVGLGIGVPELSGIGDADGFAPTVFWFSERPAS
ncbi:MAG: hypothetical protein ACR2GO_06380 [Candidatus Limnocylindria bacterium]